MRCDIWYDPPSSPLSRENSVNYITSRGTTAEQQVRASVRRTLWAPGRATGRASAATAPASVHDFELDRHGAAEGYVVAVAMVALVTFVGTVLRFRIRRFEACGQGVFARL